MGQDSVYRRAGFEVYDCKEVPVEAELLAKLG